jgi:hypothetical protein
LSLIITPTRVTCFPSRRSICICFLLLLLIPFSHLYFASRRVCSFSSGHR